MPLTAAQIVTLALQDAKCPGFTSQGGQFLNAALQDYCQLYDLEAALGTYNFSFNTGGFNGSGPYPLPADYLRTRVQDGKDEFFYTLNGVPYPLIQCTLTEYDWMVQTPGFQNFPYYYATDLSPVTLGQPASLKVWPPASGSYPCVMRYFRLMPDIVTPEVSAVVPWFTNTMILQRDVAGRLMGLTGDSRQADYLADDDQHPLGVGNLMRKYLRNIEDREGAVHTVGRDRRRWGRSFDLLKNTKTIGWVLLAACLWFMSPVDQAHANCTTPCTKAQIATDIATNWPDNSTGGITPALLRSTVTDLLNSYLDIGGAASFTCPSHQWMNSIASLTSYTCAQPAVSDISGFGTGVAAALAISIGTAGSPVLWNGGGGTPTSLTLTNATGLPPATGLVTDPTAWSFLGNPTSAAAGYAPFTIGSLTNKPSPATTDLLVLQDAGTGALRNCQITQCMASISAGVTTVNGHPGAIIGWSEPQGRLSLTSGVAIMTGSVAGATTIYYVGGAGHNVPIYDGVAVAQYQICAANTVGACQLSVVLGSNWTANTFYDWYIAYNGGTPTLCSVAWTNSTTRATALTPIDGLNSNATSFTCATSNSTSITPASNQATYVGTCETGLAGQFNHVYGAASAGGTAANIQCWNAYKPVTQKTTVSDTTASWTYNVATTWRAANAGNVKGTFVRGLAQDSLEGTYYALSQAGAGSNAEAGVGIDSTTSFCGITAVFTQSATLNSGVADCTAIPGIGAHTLAAIEFNSTTTASTWFGAANAAGQTGLTMTFTY